MFSTVTVDHGTGSLGQWLVPDGEGKETIGRRIIQARDVVAILHEICPRKGVAVQAGGSWGPWPLAFSRIFDRVYTFEPDWVSFAALCINTRLQNNIYRFQAALGNSHGMVGLTQVDSDNRGTNKLNGAGSIPTIRIDDLALDACDLIYLDTEGSEGAALHGAEDTIIAYDPMVAFEDRPYKTGAQEYLEGLGYTEKCKIGSDRVMVAGR